MCLRGTELQGDDFDSLQVVSEASAHFLLASFSGGYLSSCIIECVIPLLVVSGDNILQGLLHAHIELGETEEIEGHRGCGLQLRLEFGDHSYVSTGKHGGFWDDELFDIGKLLPPGTYIKSCINCALGDRGRYQGAFGAVGCYRVNKAAYFQFKQSDWHPERKWELLDLRTEDVQETYLCPEFEKRITE
jgi:hypothetical protein